MLLLSGSRGEQTRLCDSTARGKLVYLHSREGCFGAIFKIGDHKEHGTRTKYVVCWEYPLPPSILILPMRWHRSQLLLEPLAVVQPGGCYTVRGSVLAVHAVVDQKHRVYACITAEDVPFSVGLSLLEEVRSTPLKPFLERQLGVKSRNPVDGFHVADRTLA